MAETALTAEIVSIGDEITSGSIVDTNSAWISKELTALGVRTLWHTTVGDEMQAMADVFRTAVLRADLVIISGGLGPTEDDLTRQAAAQLAGAELVRDDESLKIIREMFAKRKRPMPDSNFIQAYFPEKSRIIPNPNGTAPGFELEIDRARFGGTGTSDILTFPGVPAELKEMWRATGSERVLAQIEHKIGHRRQILTRSIHCFGPGESDIESRLPHLIARDHVPRVGITASSGIITLRIFAEGEDFAECQKQLNETANVIYDRVGDFVFGEGEQTIPSVTADKLLAVGKKLAVIEWGTAGFLAKTVPGSVFAGGLVDSESRPVCSLLGLADDAEPETIFRTFAEKIGVDTVIGVGRYPDEEERKDPEKTSVFVYALTNGEFFAQSFVYGLHPSIIDTLFACRALDLLRRNL